MTTSDCLIHWRPTEFTDMLTGWPVTLSREATLGLDTISLQRLNAGQIVWVVYDPVTKRQYQTTIGDFTNG